MIFVSTALMDAAIGEVGVALRWNYATPPPPPLHLLEISTARLDKRTAGLEDKVTDKGSRSGAKSIHHVYILARIVSLR